MRAFGNTQESGTNTQMEKLNRLEEWSCLLTALTRKQRHGYSAE